MDKTLQKMASDLGLSVMSVSRALQGRGGVSEATRDRVRAAADAAGYRPNLIARALLTGRTNNIGIIASNFADPATAQMFGAIESLLRQQGLQALPGAFGRDAAQAESILENLMAQRVDGIVSIETGVGLPMTIAAGIASIPSVILSLADADPTGALGASTDRVVCATSATVSASVRHLLSLGRKRLTLLAHRDEIAEASLIESWLAAHREAGIAVDASLLLLGVADAKGAESCAQRLSHLDGDPIDAIVATTGTLAAGALHGCRRAGRSVGRRFQDSVSILCLNDSPICSLLDPAITAFTLLYDEMASRSVERLAAHIATPPIWQPERIAFDATLISRATA